MFPFRFGALRSAKVADFQQEVEKRISGREKHKKGTRKMKRKGAEKSLQECRDSP